MSGMTWCLTSPPELALFVGARTGSRAGEFGSAASVVGCGVESEFCAEVVLLLEKTTPKPTNTATIRTKATARAGHRLAERGGIGNGAGGCGTERPGGNSRAWISANEDRRLGSSRRHSRTIPRYGSGMVSGRVGFPMAVSSAMVTFWVIAATRVTPTDQTSLAGEIIPAAVSGASYTSCRLRFSSGSAIAEI